jgi:16S rRNA G966 N2-methylase RsmD
VKLTERQIEELRAELAAFGDDIYARKGVAYQHFEIGDRVLIEGEHKERSRERIHWIHDVGVEEKTVLDIGCNLGLYAIESACRGAKLATGIDIQPNVVKAADTIRKWLALENCRFLATDLTDPAARAEVEPADVVFAFAVYDHLTGRHKQTPPTERELAYIEVTEWLARITKQTLIVEYHNRQARWLPFFSELLLEHGFTIARKQIMAKDRPVLFCRRVDGPTDAMVIDGRTYRRLDSWTKRKRKIYLLERDGDKFLCKRYSSDDLAKSRRPEDECLLLEEFADFPEVVIPVCFDERRVVLPYVGGRPVKVIDDQPVQAADIGDLDLRLRIVGSVSLLLARYFKRRDALYRKFVHAIPEQYREEVRRGDRILVDVSPSNILVLENGSVRFVDFEPSKPSVTRTVVASLQKLLDGVSPSRKGFFSGFLSRKAK